MAAFRVVCFVAVAGSVHAHLSFTDRSMIACDINAQSGINWMAMPILEGAPYKDWWFHGQVNCQSKVKRVFELRAGGSVQIAMSSRISKVPPPWGFDGGKWAPSDPDRVLTESEWGDGPGSRGNTLDNEGNLHAYARRDTSGCALAIAYKSTATAVTPSDFVIFSVVHDCPKRQRETFKVPNLPACSGNCICAWFWIPKNSGTKNFYMTGFECKVTGTVGTSPVDVAYAIPPRRCLDPKLCNFGPRNPMYWLGTGSQINMPEEITQSPHYSIFYGFREGAQTDIFIATNPRRNPSAGFPSEQKCSGEASRLTSTKSSFSLKSPNCACTAKLSGGHLAIKKGDSTVWSTNSYSSFGPDVLRSSGSQKASTSYFKKAVGPYRIDLNNKCYLALSDNNGMVLWESPFSGSKAQDYIVEQNFGRAPDPSEWGVGRAPAAFYQSNGTECSMSVKAACAAANKEDCDPGSAECGSCKDTFTLSGETCVPESSVAKCNDGYCENWCNTPGQWGCGAASDGNYTCNCDKCTVGIGRLCNKELTGGTACNTAQWTQLKYPATPCSTECQAIVTTFPFQTCNEYCNLQGHTCEGAFEDADNKCTGYDTNKPATCSTRFMDKYKTTDMICLCGKTRASALLVDAAEKAELLILHDADSIAAFKAMDETTGDTSSAQAAAPALALLASSVFVLATAV